MVTGSFHGAKSMGTVGDDHPVQFLPHLLVLAPEEYLAQRMTIRRENSAGVDGDWQQPWPG
jgi:hypothetical protein